MPSLFDARDREALLQRLSRLQPTNARQWGKMNAAQMLAHCAAALEVATGESAKKQALIGRVLAPFVKTSILGDKPMSKNAPTDPAFRIADERDFATERQRVTTLVERFAGQGPSAANGRVHSFFGRLTADEWSRLMYKHPRSPSPPVQCVSGDRQASRPIRRDRTPRLGRHGPDGMPIRAASFSIRPRRRRPRRGSCGRFRRSEASRDGSGARVVALFPLQEGQVYQSPRWSPDDRAIAFESAMMTRFETLVFIVAADGATPATTRSWASSATRRTRMRRRPSGRCSSSRRRRPSSMDGLRAD